MALRVLPARRRTRVTHITAPIRGLWHMAGLDAVQRSSSNEFQYTAIDFKSSGTIQNSPL
jgi:hypothetical protein